MYYYVRKFLVLHYQSPPPIHHPCRVLATTSAPCPIYQRKSTKLNNARCFTTRFKTVQLGTTTISPVRTPAEKNLFMLYLRLWAVLVDQSYINDVSWLILVCARVIHTYSHVIDIFITVGAYLICIWHSSEKDLISLRHYPCKYIWFPFDYYAEFHNWHRQEGSDFSHVRAPRPVHYGWKALLVRIELSNVLSDHRADMCNSLTFRFHDTESMEWLGVWFGV